MRLTEGLLIAVIIMLIVVVVAGRGRGRGSMRTRTLDCVDRGNGEVTSVRLQYTGHPSGCKCSNCSNYEKQSLKENAEYFTDCANIKPDLSMCGDDRFEYAVSEFGAPGMDFKDWVASQAIDPQVIKNHAEFVQDRLKNDAQNVTGRTYSPDSHDSYDPISWIGLRRPQAVAVCNPTQVPDVDYNLYSQKPKFTWSSS